MSKNNRKRKPCKIEVTNDQKNITISTDELKELIISAIKEERAKEDDASSSNVSFAMQLFAILIYVLFYLVFIVYIIELCSAGIMSGDVVFQIILSATFCFLMILLGYNMAKNKSKNDISQHFTVLTTLFALFIALFMR